MVPQNDDTAKLLIRARTQLLFKWTFWGTLALRLRLHEDPGCASFWTDGTTLGYNPAFVQSLKFDEVMGLVARATAHCALGHPWRRAGRDTDKWGEACERVVNPILRRAKLKLPQTSLFEYDESHVGKSAEWVYSRLPDKPALGAKGSATGTGQAQESKDTEALPVLVEVRDAPRPGSNPADHQSYNTEDSWQRSIRQSAAITQGRGDLPGDLARLFSLVEPKVDWRPLLHQFAQEVGRRDYSMSRPNYRHLARGFYLPTLRSRDEMGVLVVAGDTSGSMDRVLMNQIASEVQAIADQMRPREIHVVWCDAKVHRVDVFEQHDIIELNPVGGGGTDFRPVFDYVRGLDEPPACLIYLTDLAGRFPDEEPAYPVLWATTHSRRIAPFGETIRVS